MRKRNEHNKISRYKAQLVAQCFSQRHDINNEGMYYSVMDLITF